MTTDGFDDLRRAVRRRFGERSAVEIVEVPTHGGSNRTIIFDLMDGTARRRLVSRQETYTAAGSPFLTVADQFHVIQIAHAHGFPVAEPLFAYDAADNMGNGFVSAFFAGE